MVGAGLHEAPLSAPGPIGTGTPAARTWPAGARRPMRRNRWSARCLAPGSTNGAGVMRRLAPRRSIRPEGNDMIVIYVIVALLLVVLAASVRILKQYELGVQFRLGRVTGGARGPGLIFIVPLVDRVHRV